jgi:hypothetical protein
VSDAKPKGWILSHQFPPATNPAELATSQTASDRIRGYPLSSCSQVNWLCGRPELLTPPNLDILFVGKPPILDVVSLERWLGWIKACAAHGALVVLDFTDNHLSPSADPVARNFYAEAIPLANVVTVPTDSLKSALLSFGFDRPYQVINDLVEQETSRPAKHLKNEVPVGLWFGHSQNIRYLRQHFEAQHDLWVDRRFILLTDEAWFESSGLAVNEWTQLDTGPIVYPYPWSIRAMEDAGSIADFALVPSDPGDDRKNGASPNRLVSALTLGLPTIASPLQSYLEFCDCWTDINSRDEVEKLRDNPTMFSGQVTLFQTKFLYQFKADFVGNQWNSLISRLWSAQ